MPYNYIFYEKLRKSLKIIIQNNIIVFDEAHHCKRISETSESISITLNSLPTGLKRVITQSIRKLNNDYINKTIIVGEKIRLPLTQINNKIKEMNSANEL